MTYRLRIRDEARTDLASATGWYRSQRPGLELEFLARVEARLSVVVSNPEMFPVVYRDVRRTFVERFPYRIYYRVRHDLVEVVAVYHGRRDPSTWQPRVDD